MRGVSRMDEPDPEMFVNELSEGHHFGLRKGIHGTYRRGCPLFNIDFEIIWTMRHKRIGFRLAKNVSKVMIVLRYMDEVRNFLGYGSRFARDGGIGEVNPETLHTWLFRGMGESRSTN